MEAPRTLTKQHTLTVCEGHKQAWEGSQKPPKVLSPSILRNGFADFSTVIIHCTVFLLRCSVWKGESCPHTASAAFTMPVSWTPGLQLISAVHMYVCLPQSWEGVQCGDGGWALPHPLAPPEVSTFCSLLLPWLPMSSCCVLGLSELIFLDQGRSSGFKKNGSLGIKQIPLPAQ